MASRTFRKDPLTGIPLQHFSLILNVFLPSSFFDLPQLIESEGVVYDFWRAMDVGLCSQLIGCGSSLEALTILSYRNRNTELVTAADADFFMLDKDHIVLQNIRDCESQAISNTIPLYMDDSGCHTGYVRLRKSYNDASIADSANWYTAKRIKAEDDMRPDPFPWSFTSENHGPAFNLVHNKDGTGPLLPRQDLQVTNLSVDMVTALRCDEWPEAAVEWTTRERTSGWPNPDFIVQLTASGCHAVQVAHPDSIHSDGEWRLSFSVTEKALARSLTMIQRKCYVLLKLAVSFAPVVFKSTKILCSYHLKTVLLWVCETIPASAFTEETTAERLFDLLDKLMSFLKDGNLPNYFVRENNMIDHLSTSDRETALLVLQKLRASPIKVFLHFDKENHFVFTEGLFPSILKTLDLAFRDMNHVYYDRPCSESPDQVFVRLLKRIINVYVVKKVYIQAVRTLLQLVNVKKSTCAVDADIRTLVKEILDTLPANPNAPSVRIFWKFCFDTLPIENADILISTFSTRNRFLSSLIKYFLQTRLEKNAEYSEKENKQLDGRIHFTFSEVIWHHKRTAKNVLDFHSWLIFEQNKTADNLVSGFDFLQMLQAYLRDSKPQHIMYDFVVEEFVTYEKEDTCLLHDPLLKGELERTGHLQIATSVYVQYLIIERAVRIEGKEFPEALKALDEMVQVCATMKTSELSQKMLSVCQSLLRLNEGAGADH